METNWIELNITSRNRCKFECNQQRTLFRKSSAQAEYVDLFRYEFDAMKKIHSPYFPRYTEYYLDASRSYIVMEYVKGQTLTKYLENHSTSITSGPHTILTEVEFLDVCRQVYEALCTLANNGILHYDLSSDNIIITKVNGHIKLKLIDFTSCDHSIPEYRTHVRAINSELYRNLPPPLALLCTIQLFFVRVFFKSEISYRDFLRESRNGSLNCNRDFFPKSFDLILAPDYIDLDYIKKSVASHFSVHKDPLICLTSWYKKLFEDFRKKTYKK